MGAVNRAADPAELPARLVLGSIGLFWVGWIALMSARAGLLNFEEPVAMLLRRVIAAIAGGVLTLLFWRVLRRVQARRPAALALAALAGAIPATMLFAVVNWALFYAWPTAATRADVARWGADAVFRYAVIDTSVSWYFFFAGWGLTYLFLAAGHRAQRAERLEADAVLKALRFQLNPHFLFNALNTLADLIAEDRAAADRMVLDLSALLRRMLVDSSDASVPLADEIALQRHYLAIEQARFGGRLTVTIELPEALSHVRVPALILQPLVENAVKHGLDASATPTTITIRVRVEDGALILSVTNTGGGAVSRRPGFGIGVDNVRERLRLLHGGAAALTTEPLADGWRATIRLPHG